jgi:lysozyme
MKAIEAPKRDDQIRNLRFFVAAGFIQDADRKITNMRDEALLSGQAPSAELTALLGDFEGVNLTPYQDANGYWVVGFGHLLSQDSAGANVDKSPITYTRALEYLAHDLKLAEAAIDELVKVPLSPRQKDVLASFVFNLGAGNFKHSTLLTQLNAGNYGEVPKEMRRWVTAHGSSNPSLVRRRESEIEMWNKGASK